MAVLGNYKMLQTQSYKTIQYKQIVNSNNKHNSRFFVIVIWRLFLAKTVIFKYYTPFRENI